MSERRYLRSWSCAAALTALLFFAQSASADGASARDNARDAFRIARAAFARGEYAAAAEAFERAAVFEPHAAPLLNAADAWERAGDWARAADDCDRALSIADSEPSLRDVAAKKLEKLVPRVGTLDFIGPNASSVRVDDAQVLRVPSRKRLLPGSHSLAFIDADGSQRPAMLVTLAPGERRTIDLGPSPSPSSLPSAPARPDAALSPAASSSPRDDERGAPRSPEKGGPPLASWIGFGIAGASLATSGVLGVWTLDRQSEFERHPTNANADAFESLRLGTNVALGVAAVAAITAGAVWLLTPSRK